MPKPYPKEFRADVVAVVCTGGPSVHDDLLAVVDDKGRVRHEFTATAVNQVRCSGITEHRTGEGKHTRIDALRILCARSREASSALTLTLTRTHRLVPQTVQK